MDGRETMRLLLLLLYARVSVGGGKMESGRPHAGGGVTNDPPGEVAASGGPEGWSAVAVELST